MPLVNRRQEVGHFFAGARPGHETGTVERHHGKGRTFFPYTFNHTIICTHDTAYRRYKLGINFRISSIEEFQRRQ